MSIEQVTLIACDAPNCQATFVHPNDPKHTRQAAENAALDAAMKQGWAGTYPDYCPDHVGTTAGYRDGSPGYDHAAGYHD